MSSFSLSSSFSSSISSYASSDIRDRPDTPPQASKSNGGLRLPRFSLWGRNTSSTLISNSNNSSAPSSNTEPDLTQLRISQRRPESPKSPSRDRSRQAASESELPSRPSSPTSVSSMPTLAVNAPLNAPPISLPKLSSVWRMSAGLFTSSSYPANSHDPRLARPHTAESTTPRDFINASPASQFAAWSEFMHSPTPPDRTATFSSNSSASCNSCSRPNMKKIRSQESIRSSTSAVPFDAENSTSSHHSTIPVPKVIKVKLRSKSKANQEPEFDNVFLAQELRCSSTSSAPGSSLNRKVSQARSPSLALEDLPANRGAESRRKRSSWAARRPTSPQTFLDRHYANHPNNAVRSSDDREDDESLYIRPPKVNRQFSTSSYLTTASSTTTSSSNAGEAVAPRSPRMPSEVDEAGRVKRTKSTMPKRKTYALQFSLDGRYLAAAGSDHLIRVYEVISSPADRADEIELAQMHRAEQAWQKKMSSACPQGPQGVCGSMRSNTKMDVRAATPELVPVFKSTPIHIFQGHAGDVLDLSWSKNNFLLSSSTDKTAKLWHPNRSECLCTFSTSATVSSVDFHPTDDRFFVSGGLDGKLRLWNIAARRVQSINDVPGVITAVAFSSSGSSVCVGTHSGSMLTFSCTDSLTFVNAVTVKSAAASKTALASKITSIQPIKLDVTATTDSAAPPSAREYMTVTSNDSRIRIYSIVSRRIVSRFKSTSYINRSSQIRATSSSDSQFLVSGSEDAWIHVWSLASNASLFAALFAGMKRNKSTLRSPAQARASDAGDNSTYRSWQAGAGSVRCAIFAPAATSALLALAHDPLELNHATPGSAVRSRIIVSTDDSNIIRTWRCDPHRRLF